MALEEIVCLNHLFRQKEYFKNIIYRENHGRCSICVSDENNKYCSGYVPIKLIKYDVMKDDNFRGFA